MNWLEIRMSVIRGVAWLLGCSFVLSPVPQGIPSLMEKLRPAVIAMAREGKLKQWNGDSKRRMLISRLIPAWPKESTRDLTLALELILRTL